MQKLATTLAFALFFALAANAQSTNLNIVAADIDNKAFGATTDSFLVEALWEDAIGCPTNARYFNGSTRVSYTDPACTTTDKLADNWRFGLLLSKIGPIGNFAAAAGDFRNEPGKVLTELGYDLRHGSTCGAGAPRFNVELQNGAFYFVGCASPPPTSVVTGTDWDRMRWGDKANGIPVLGFNSSTGVLEPIPTNIPIKSMMVVFDEPGLATIDNVDLSGTLIGKPSR